MSTERETTLRALIDRKDSRRKLEPITLTDEKETPDYTGLNGLRTISPPEVGEDSILIRAEQSETLEACPRCRRPLGDGFKRNGTRAQRFYDEPRGFRSVRIEVRRQSYLCVCGAATQQPIKGLDENRNMTSRLLHYVQISACIESFLTVAHTTGLSTKTVRDIFADYADTLERTVSFKTPRALGLDGVYVGGKECAILSDLETKLVIDMWKDYRLDQLVTALRRIPERENIEVVVIDMSRKLRRAVQSALPQAVIVIDRHHIQTLANKGVDEVRKALRRQIQRRKGSPTMCKRDILRKRWDQLTDVEKRYLSRWFSLRPELQTAYELKESFCDIWHSSSSASAREKYGEWLKRIPIDPTAAEDNLIRTGFKKLLTAMKNWEEYIFNYFDHRHTNGYTEQSNRQVKDLIRVARGCKFETVRAKIIYGTLIKKQRKAIREKKAERKRAERAQRRPLGRVRSKKSVPEPSIEPVPSLEGVLGRPICLQATLFDLTSPTASAC